LKLFIFEKKYHRMQIVYYNIATIGISINQFYKKIINILVFWIILYFFLLTIFSYMWYNSKCIEVFQACSQLALKNESKGALHTNMELFSYKCHLIECNCLVFFRAKKNIFVNSSAIILQSIWWKFLKICSTCSQVIILQDPIVTYVQKCFSSKIWYLY